MPRNMDMRKQSSLPGSRVFNFLAEKKKFNVEIKRHIKRVIVIIKL